MFCPELLSASFLYDTRDGTLGLAVTKKTILKTIQPVPNERSIASLPDTRVSIQFVPFTLARNSSGALSLNGAVGLAHSPGQNLRGQSAPTKVPSIAKSQPPLKRVVPPILTHLIGDLVLRYF
jgi:hypothetical protein